MGHYPQVQAFIKSDKAREYPNLIIKYVRGADPVIKMIDSEGNDEEVEVSIAKWDTDAIEEYLKEHLL